MYNDEVREEIIQLKTSNDTIQSIFQMLSRRAIVYYCPLDKEDSLVEVKIDNKKYVVIGTSEEILNVSREFIDISKSIKLGAIEIFKIIFNLGTNGAIINLEDKSQLVLDIEMVKLLYREIIAMELYIRGGAYVIENGNDYLLIELDNLRLLNIYISKEEADSNKDILSNKGKIVFKKWKDILKYYIEAKCTALVYDFNEKDVTFIKDPYLAWLYNSPF